MEEDTSAVAATASYTVAYFMMLLVVVTFAVVLLFYLKCYIVSFFLYAKKANNHSWTYCQFCSNSVSKFYSLLLYQVRDHPWHR